MDSRYYRDMIVRAVLGKRPAMTAIVADPETLDLIARQLADCEDAKAILRAKHWGPAGTSVVEVARSVPDAPKVAKNIWSGR